MRKNMKNKQNEWHVVNKPLKLCSQYYKSLHLSSVADPGGLSRILILTHPGSQIQNQQQKRGGEKN
jgi:hypothetical protein